jgi:hypothetical protein
MTIWGFKNKARRAVGYEEFRAARLEKANESFHET